MNGNRTITLNRKNMNREIKFRGKRIDNGQWAYGSLVINPFVRTEGDNAYYIIDDALMEFHWEDMRPIQVSPETVGQYVTLTDSTGKAVYEGDIVQYDSEDGIITSAIEFKEDNGDSMLISGFFFKYIKTEEYEDDDPKEFKVIGNRWDNPKLLAK